MSVESGSDGAFRSSSGSDATRRSFSRSDIVLGMSLGLGALVAMIVLAWAVAGPRSDQPAVVGGGYFLGDASPTAASSDGPPSFNLVNGDPEIRIQDISRYFAGRSVPGSSLVPLNSLAGLYLLDPGTGALVSFDRDATSRDFAPYQMSPGLTSSGRVSGLVAGEAVYVVTDAARCGGASSAVAVSRFHPDDLERYASSPDFSPTQAYTAPITCFEGTLESASVAGDMVWLAVNTGDQSSLYMLGPPEDPRGSQLASAQSQPDVDDDAPVSSEELDTITTVEVGNETRIQALGAASGSDATVAAAVIDNGLVEIRYVDQAGLRRSVPFPELAGVEAISVAGRGDMVWFIVQDQQGVWAAGSDPSGAKRLVSFGDRTPAAASVVGQVLVVADQATGDVEVFNLQQSGETLVAETDGEQPLRYAYPWDENDVRQPESVEVTTVGNRVIVNAIAARRALLLGPDGRLIAELDKTVPRRFDESDLIGLFDPDTTAETLPGPPTTMAPGGPAPSPSPDECKPDEPIGQIRNLRVSPAQRTATVSFEYRTAVQLSGGTCLPRFVTEVRRGASGDAQRIESGINGVIVTGLDTDTAYEVRVVARFDTANQQTATVWVPFRTLARGPDPASEFTVKPNDEGWEIDWGLPEVGGERRTSWVVSTTDPQPRSVTLGASDRQLQWDFTEGNVGQSLVFAIRAVGPTGPSDTVSSQPVESNRPIDPARLESYKPNFVQAASGSNVLVSAQWTAPQGAQFIEVFGARNKALSVTSTINGSAGSTQLVQPGQAVDFDAVSVDPGQVFGWTMSFSVVGVGEQVVLSGQQSADSVPCTVTAATYSVGEPEDSVGEPEDADNVLSWTLSARVTASDPAGCAIVAGITNRSGACGAAQEESTVVTSRCVDPLFGLIYAVDAGYFLQDSIQPPSLTGDSFRVPANLSALEVNVLVTFSFEEDLTGFAINPDGTPADGIEVTRVVTDSDVFDFNVTSLGTPRSFGFGRQQELRLGECGGRTPPGWQERSWTRFGDPNEGALCSLEFIGEPQAQQQGLPASGALVLPAGVAGWLMIRRRRFG